MIVNCLFLLQLGVLLIIFNPFNCVYIFVIVGDGCVDRGEPTGVADTILSLSSSLLLDLLTERITMFNAYMGGQLTVVGDLRAAVKLSELFKLLNHK